jgi:hypothetical protein
MPRYRPERRPRKNAKKKNYRNLGSEMSEPKQNERHGKRN